MFFYLRKLSQFWGQYSITEQYLTKKVSITNAILENLPQKLLK